MIHRPSYLAEVPDLTVRSMGGELTISKSRYRWQSTVIELVVPTLGCYVKRLRSLVAHLLEPHAVIAEVVLLDEEDQMPHALAAGTQNSVVPVESLLPGLLRAPL